MFYCLIFNLDEKVIIYLELKNIKFLKVKIYKIEPEAYYVNNFKEIDLKFDLDGFIPNEEKSLEFNEPQSKKFETEIEFNKISEAKKGIFFIDFIGEGLSARAIIKKGKIHLIKKETLVGHVVTIHDENFKLIKQGKLGIWVKGNFYRGDKNGEIIIPYGKTNETVSIVISVGSNAYLDKFEIFSENFEFSFEVLYCNESIIPNKTVDFYLQPQ